MANPLKVGLVGTGGISNRHMDAYLRHPDRVRLTAVCDVVKPLAEQYAKKTGVEAVYTDYETMLREADIDAVDVCTGHRHHAAQTIAAAEAGKHALTEKAMANTLAECRAMIAAADKAGTTLMVAQHLRHSPEAWAAKRLIDEGRLGAIQAARTHVIMRGPKNESWMNDAKEGGGVLLLNSVHHLDLLRYYVGDVKRVTGMRRSVQPQMANGAEDLAAATLEFENGAIGDAFASWTTYVANEGASYTVIGSNGTLRSTPPSLPSADSPVRHFGDVLFGRKEELDPRNPEDLQKLIQAPFEPLDTSGANLPSANFFVNEILHFEECCRTGEEPVSSGRDNIETMKIVFGIVESSRTGMAVDLASL